MLFSNVTCHDVQVGGIAFDAFGNFWATMIFADRLVAVTPEGDVLELLNDVDLAATARFEAAFAAGGTVDFEIMLACGGPICTWMPSITFGGADLSTVYLGGLRSTSIPSFRSPVAGLPMVHWLPTAPPPGRASALTWGARVFSVYKTGLAVFAFIPSGPIASSI